MQISLSKILAVAAPVISTIAATAATWLVVHINLFATFHIGKNGLAQAIGQGIVWGVTAVGTYLIQHKVLGQILVKEANEHLAGLQRAQMEEQVRLQRQAATPPPPPAVS